MPHNSKRRKRLLLAAVAILLFVSACAPRVERPVDWINPFCISVGTPPPSLILDEGEPAGWIDDYLAVHETECEE